jgi:hypothetical protein
MYWTCKSQYFILLVRDGISGEAFKKEKKIYIALFKKIA